MSSLWLRGVPNKEPDSASLRAPWDLSGSGHLPYAGIPLDPERRRREPEVWKTCLFPSVLQRIVTKPWLGLELRLNEAWCACIWYGSSCHGAPAENIPLLSFLCGMTKTTLHF